MSTFRQTHWHSGTIHCCTVVIKKHSAGYLQHSDEVSSPSARMGHHAMPMLWGEQMLGWANLKAVDRRLQQIGF